jgi:hypothetical protein
VSQRAAKEPSAARGRAANAARTFDLCGLTWFGTLFSGLGSHEDRWTAAAHARSPRSDLHAPTPRRWKYPPGGGAVPVAGTTTTRAMPSPATGSPTWLIRRNATRARTAASRTATGPRAAAARSLTDAALSRHPPRSRHAYRDGRRRGGVPRYVGRDDRKDMGPDVAFPRGPRERPGRAPVGRLEHSVDV